MNKFGFMNEVMMNYLMLWLIMMKLKLEGFVWDECSRSFGYMVSCRCVYRNCYKKEKRSFKQEEDEERRLISKARQLTTDEIATTLMNRKENAILSVLHTDRQGIKKCRKIQIKKLIKRQTRV